MSKNQELISSLVIGSSVMDAIRYSDRMEKKPGGIYYTVLRLASICSKKDTVQLLTNYDKNSFNLFEPVYKKVRMKYSFEVAKINSVQLNVWDDGGRCESFDKTRQGLILHDEIDYNAYDGILINMITGHDITQAQLEEIRKVFNGKIYFDLHSLSRGFDKNGKRVHMQIPHSEDWLKCIDILQCNEIELYTIFNFDNELKIINAIFQQGVKTIIVTRGAKGSTLYHKQDNSDFIVTNKDGLKVNSINHVGCGDIFGAVFFYNYILFDDYERALESANKAAGKSTEFSSFEQYEQLKFL